MHDKSMGGGGGRGIMKRDETLGCQVPRVGEISVDPPLGVDLMRQMWLQIQKKQTNNKKVSWVASGLLSLCLEQVYFLIDTVNCVNR